MAKLNFDVPMVSKIPFDNTKKGADFSGNFRLKALQGKRVLWSPKVLHQ